MNEETIIGIAVGWLALILVATFFAGRWLIKKFLLKKEDKKEADKIQETQAKNVIPTLTDEEVINRIAKNKP